MITINSEGVLAQKKEKEDAAHAANQNKDGKNSNTKFDYDELKKHYLNTSLPKELESREIIIRPLPFSPKDNNVFKKIHVHNVNVLNKNGKKQWQKFMCPIFFQKDDKCPFCEVADEARKLMYAETDERKKKGYKDVLFMNEAKNYWAMRCIERGHEDDGPKFWFFPDKVSDGVFDKITAIQETRLKRGTDIYNPYNGKDLIITIKRVVQKDKEKIEYQITDDDVLSPISKSEEQMEAWANDTTRFSQLYPTKPYDYLRVLMEGGFPVWAKDLKTYVDKDKLADMLKEAKEEEIKENLMPQDKDFSSFTINTGTTNSETVKISESKQEDKAFSSLVQNHQSDNVGDDVLPY